MRSVQEFIQWLAATPLSATIQDVSWIIPTVQTIHILGIAIVMSAALLVNLRVLGVLSRTEPLDAISQRYVPWIWVTLVVLLLSGSTLIIGEPDRSLCNPAFIAKMTMLLVVIGLTLSLRIGLRRDARYWERSGARRLRARVLAGVSLTLWIAIVFAGRWIAYISTDGTG